MSATPHAGPEKSSEPEPDQGAGERVEGALREEGELDSERLPERDDAPLFAPEPSPVAPRPGERGAAQEEVLVAAAQAFMERGFAATSIDDVARVMNATKGRVYHYYRSKLELFNDVTRRSLEMIHAEVAAAEAAGGDPDRRMERMVRTHAGMILRERAFHRTALQGVELHLRIAASQDQRAAVADLISLRDAHERLFVRVLAEGVAADRFRPCDVKVTVRTLLPALNGPVFWYRPREGETDADRAAIVDQITAFAMSGLRLRP
ncbi:MAG: TetR family transcriptional regulator [Rhodobacteraceae bacterium]|nr:TetR family transcriptional regulator [Paracoccaceae bacterium]MBR25424.1 TetR family transcriptional regulator [Paracoccaceae bacterium]